MRCLIKLLIAVPSLLLRHYLVILFTSFYAMPLQYSRHTASKSATFSSAELNQYNNSEYLHNLFASSVDFAEKLISVFSQTSAAS
jgi:hypothetical protein